MSTLLDQAWDTLNKMGSHSLGGGKLNFRHNNSTHEWPNQIKIPLSRDSPNMWDFNPRGAQTLPAAEQGPQEAATGGDKEIFDYLLHDIQNGGPYSRLWPHVSAYCRRELGRERWAQLEQAHKNQQQSRRK